jgi:hypothetical protein
VPLPWHQIDLPVIVSRLVWPLRCLVRKNTVKKEDWSDQYFPKTDGLRERRRQIDEVLLMFGWRRKTTDAPVASRESGDHLILFVHGIGGSVSGTWREMLSVLKADVELDHCSFDCFAYPTRLIRLPFGPRMPGIQQIARGLGTHISANHAKKRRITLVGHSLGGLIARQHILELIKEDACGAITDLILYASPNTGAALAGIGAVASWRHRHLKQLARESDLLALLNRDWKRLKIEERIRTLYVVGGADSVVDGESSDWQVGASKVATLIEHGHLTIKEPASVSDIRYKVLKDFVLDIGAGEDRLDEPRIQPTSQAGDVLFDVYTPAAERYYVTRLEDDSLIEAARNANLWVSGASGVGKTAALRRLAEQSQWHLHHVSLGGCIGLDALNLVREMCNEIGERAGVDRLPSSETPLLHELLAHFRKSIGRLAQTRVVGLIVEEIPLAGGSEYTNLLSAFSHLVTASETGGLPNRIVWLFASINNPRPSLPPASAKFLERVQLLRFANWSDADIERLTNLIDTTLGCGMGIEEKLALIHAADGNPRFIKMVFRRRRNELGARQPLDQLISSVRADL